MNKTCKMHIMHIASGDLWAGAESQLFTLVTTLHKDLKATVSVVILNHGKLEKMLRQEGIKVIVLDEKTLSGFQILRQLISIARKLKPDVIHTHRIKENIFGSIAASVNGNIPSMRTQHGAPEHNPMWYQIPKQGIRFLDWFCGNFIQKKIIAVSDTLAQQLRKHFREEKVQVVENGIDIKFIRQYAAADASQSPYKSWKIGIAGRLVPVKRLDLFIQIAKQLKEDHPELDLEFHIFGDGPLREELNILNSELGTDGYVTLEGHCDNLAERLSQMDMLTMTSDHEGLPMTLLEAMCLKIPIIAHSVGGIPRLLDNGRCGILVDEHTPFGYAHAIHQLMREHENRKMIAQNAFDRVSSFYSAKNNAQNICGFYHEITAQYS